MTGIAILVFVFCCLLGIVLFVAGTGLARQWMISRRKAMAIKMGAPRVMIYPEHYQPLETVRAKLEPLPFYPETVCPHDGFYDTHIMAAPRPHVDHADAITVRRCKNCGHIWSEK